MRKTLLFLNQWNSLNQLSQLSVEPKSKADQDKMGIALQKLQEEDPTFRAHTDEETGQIIIAGMGELHLDILVDRMRREFKVEANVGAPQVLTVKHSVNLLKLKVNLFVNQVVVDNSDTFGLNSLQTKKEKALNLKTVSLVGLFHVNIFQLLKQVLKMHLKMVLLAGYPLVDVKAKLFDGSYHDVDSSEMAFKIAASMALKNAAI